MGFILLSAGFVFGQSTQLNPFTSLNLYRITNEDGLSQVSVNVMYKDSEGFLWVGTDDGINRYDGKDVITYFYRYDDTSSLSANEIYGICEDKFGRIWFGHYNGGISVLNKKTNRFTRIGGGSGKLSTNRVYSLYSDKSGYIVARTVEGISKIDPATFKVQNFTDKSYTDLSITTHVDVVEHDGAYWFGSAAKGLLRINKEGQRLPYHNWDTLRHGKSVFGICESSANELLVVSEKGLFKLYKSLSDYKVQAIIYDTELFASASKILHYAKTNYVWVATDSKGVFIVDIIKQKVIRHLKSELVKDNLLSNSVLYLLQDSEKNVFIGTGRGVNVYSPYNNLFNNYENIFRKIPNFGHPVYAINELDNGNLLIGTRKGGAYYFDVNTLALTSIPMVNDGGSSNQLIIYHFTPYKNIYLVCTSKGIFELINQPENYRIRRLQGFPELKQLNDLKITDVHFQNDSIAWIASFTDGLFKWNYKAHTLEQIKKNTAHPSLGPVDDQIQKMVPAKNGNLILCTKYGFSVFDMKDNCFFNVLPGDNYPYELPARNIKYAYDDGDYIWVTTYGAGLHRFDKKLHTFKGYTTKEGLPNDALYSVIPDDNNRLWIGTNNGLAVLNPITGEVRTYTTQDGLPDNEFNGHSAYRSKSGKIFYSTLNGIVSVSPFLENKNNYNPDIVLTALKAENGKKDSVFNVWNKKTFTIPAGYNSVDFKFASLSFASPKNNLFEVKLEGFDNNWLRLTNNEVHYSNLQPGNYVFKVRATNNSGVWSNKVLLVDVMVLPFWYQTLFFKIVVGLLLFALGLYFVRNYYVQRLRKQRLEFEKKLAIQTERQRISSEIHDDIGAGLSAIKLLAEITKNKIPDNELQNEVSKIHASISELSGKMREVIWSLNGDNDHLENLLYYIQRQAVSLFENSSINLKVSMPTTDIPNVLIKGEKRRHIYLSVKEALHNCLKHSNAKSCYLNIAVDENILRITVTDDGKGFGNALVDHMGNGLPGMKKRMQQVNGVFELYTVENTTVQFTIPLTT